MVINNVTVATVLTTMLNKAKYFGLACAFISVSAPSFAGQYIVKSGDTLYGIANRHQMTKSEIVKLNPSIEKEHIEVGQKITVSHNKNNNKNNNTTGVVAKSVIVAPVVKNQPDAIQKLIISKEQEKHTVEPKIVIVILDQKY